VHRRQRSFLGRVLILDLFGKPSNLSLVTRSSIETENDNGDRPQKSNRKTVLWLTPHVAVLHADLADLYRSLYKVQLYF
jgi:hypothetical protein